MSDPSDMDIEVAPELIFFLNTMIYEMCSCKTDVI
jgi:hypothetical protein